MSLIIVPDSNVLWGDPFFKGVLLQSTILSAQHADIKLVVPELVQDELNNIVTEKAKSVSDKIRHQLSEAQNLNLDIKLEPPGVLSFPFEVSQVATKFVQHMDKHKAVHGTMVYADVSPKDLALLAIRRKRPFQDKDRGLRDSLLWLSIIQAAKTTDDEYVLVTDDNIFWDDQKMGLHPDLLQELKTLGLEGRIYINRSLGSVLQEHVKPKLEPSDAVLVAANSGSISDFTRRSDVIDLTIDEFLITREIPDDWYDNSMWWGAELDVVEDVELNEVVSAHKIQGDDTVLITSEWSTSIKLILTGMGGLEGYDSSTVRFTIETLVNSETLEVQGHEVTDFEFVGWCDSES